jgi:hypothetical protein
MLIKMLPRMWGLQVELEQTNRLYRKLVTEAERRGDQTKVQELYSEWSLDSGLVEEELQQIFTARLVKKARRLLLPVPETPTSDLEDEYWKRGKHFQRWYLTPIGFSKLRGLIRAEQKERREALQVWAAIVTGILGTLIGLVAVWRK